MTDRFVIVRGVVTGNDNRKVGRRVYVWCPGCDELHGPAVQGVDGDIPDGPCWAWNNNLESLTLDPSILVTGTVDGKKTVCHSFIRNGQWQYLTDCTHHLAGQTVDFVPLPDWVRG